MFSNVHQFLVEFSSNTTVHGINYFGDRQRHWIERVFWIVVFVLSMSACLFTVHKTYTKWQNSPIIVTQDDKLTALYEIPFPAVTICSAEKVKTRSRVNLTNAQDELMLAAYKMIFSGAKIASGPLFTFKFNENDKKALELSEKELLLLEAVDHICSLTNSAVDYLEDSISPKNVAKTLKTFELGWHDAMVVNSLKWKGAPINQAASLSSVFTEEGICYTFNGLKNFDIFKENAIADDFRPYGSESKTIDWNPEDGYRRTRDKKLIPLRAFNSIPRDGLSMKLFQAKDVSATGCPLSSERLKVVIHSPADFPRAGLKFVSIPFNEEIMLSVKPVMMTTSPELVKYPVNTRRCFFNSDRSLKFFKFYSQANCEFECLTNFTILACGCARVTMPRDNFTRICMIDDRYCVLESNRLYRAKNLQDVDGGIKDDDSKHKFSSKKVDDLMLYSCDCLPSCVSLNYEITTSHFVLSGNQKFEAYPESNVMIHFEDWEFLKTKRSEMYGWGDFIANCGGLLGLFMGVSILSIIEIIYFATLRLACTLKVTRKNEVVAMETGRQNTEPPVFQRTLRLQLLEWDRY